MTARHSHGWQLILADLALILFLVTLSALANEADKNLLAATDFDTDIQVAPAQALFRPAPKGPTLSEWLAERPFDARATLTVFAQHSGGDREAMWERAQSLAGSAAGEGYAVRVIITQSEVSDLHASLAYDALAPIPVQPR